MNPVVAPRSSVGSKSGRVHFGIGRVIEVQIFPVKLIVDQDYVDDSLRKLH